jgi:hypothetical protein
MLDDMLINFADSDRMKAMYAHTDTAIRFASRTICALLAKRLLQNRWFFVAELRWLEAVTEVSRYEIPGSLDKNMILKFLVCGIFPYQGVDIQNQGSNIPLAHQEGDVLHFGCACSRFRRNTRDSHGRRNPNALLSPHFYGRTFGPRLSVGSWRPPHSICSRQITPDLPRFYSTIAPALAPVPETVPEAALVPPPESEPRPRPAANKTHRFFRALS